MISLQKNAYASSGVHLGRAYRILRAIEARSNKKSVSHFATVVKVPGGPAKKLIFSADGVGTKIELLSRLNLDWISGWDCVAMNTNDLLCQGGRPLWFLDYFSQSKLDPAVFGRVLDGLKRALQAVGAELAGGETAELPGIFSDEKIYELAGFLAGIPDPRWNLSSERVRPGDVLIGLPSSGPHSNGFSLIRKVLTPAEVKKWAKELLAPTRLYHPVLEPLLRRPALAHRVHSMAHITGGGFVEKLPRALNERCQARLNLSSWEPPKIFRYLETRARISRREAMGVWNMGIGLVLALPPDAAGPAASLLKGSLEIGRVFRRSPREPAVIFG